MADDYPPKPEDFANKFEWEEAVHRWCGIDPPGSPTPGVEGNGGPIDSDVPASPKDSPSADSSSSKEFPPPDASSSSSSSDASFPDVKKEVLEEVMIVIDNQEKEITALKKELAKERARRKELERKKRGRNDSEAGPSKRR